jgi:pimeloyl-ACP methyl ester carboxylesterase
MNAEALVFVPGNMLDASLFEFQRRHLEPALPVFTVPALRGSTVAEIASDILSSAPSRFALAGLSMGGIVALEIWRQASERISHMALFSTTPLPDTPRRRAIRDVQVARVRDGGLHEVLAESIDPHYLARRSRRDGVLADSVLQMGIGLGADAFIEQANALRSRPDSRDDLPSVQCPALVLCGTEDTVCPVDGHIDMWRALADADLAVLADCGHLPTIERPRAVLHHLQDLLERRT